MEKQRKTFLSYSRANKDFAVRLARELKAEGFDVWLDQLDIPLGARWDREVERALEESEIFMIILTPASIDSENVLDEIGYAIDNSKRFMPVLLEKCTIPLRLRRFQYVDFTDKSFDDGVESAKGLLRSLINQPTIPRMVLSEGAQDQLAQAEADRKAREEAERIAKQAADEELAAKAKSDREAKAETERKAKEDREAQAEADRLAAQRAEIERIERERAEQGRLALANAEAQRKAKEEAERLAAQQVEEERLARAKAAADRKAKAEARRKAKEEAQLLTAQEVEEERKTKEKVELVSAAPAEKKPISKGLVMGGVAAVAVVLFAIAGFGINALMNRAAPAATAERLVSAVTEVNPTNTPEPTNTARPAPTSPPTPIPNFILLSASETSKLYENDQGKGILATASEQHSDTELQAFFDENQPIPVTLHNSVPTLIGNGWCATTETILMDNFKYLEIVVLIDGERIPEDQFAEIRFTDTDSNGTEWPCMRRVIAVDQWASGEHTVQQEWNITRSINDGVDDYDPQNLSTFNYVVTVP